MTDSLKILGATRLYPIIGDPIAQVRSPETITAGFATKGMNAICIPAHVPVDRFDFIIPALLEMPNIDGVLVTVADVDSHYERARAAGAHVLSAPEDTGHGRQYRVEDLEGHRWMFVQAS